MDRDKLKRTVAGESLQDLLPGLVKIKEGSWIDDDGMWRTRCVMEPEVGTPFARALMRVEAELMLADADALADDEAESRTPDQRRADALVALALRVQEALT